MRTRWLALSGALVLLLQLSWPSSLKFGWVTPNFFLVFIVLASLYVDAKRLLWVALAGGLVLDLASIGQFGFNMAFYILLVLVLKLVWQLDQRNLQLPTLLLATAVFTLLYGVVAHTSLLGSQYYSVWPGMLTRIGAEIICNGLIVAIASSIIQLRQRGIISS